MASTDKRFALTSDDAQRAMLDGLMDRVRDGLRERIMVAIKPDIDAAVEAACKSLEVAVHSYMEPMHMRPVINFIINGKPSPEG